MTIQEVPHTRGRDIIKPYILPFAIAGIITLVYMGIRYNTLNIGKVMAKSIAFILLAQILLFNIIAITRIPIGRLTIPMVIAVYLLSLYTLTNSFEQNLKTAKVEEGKKNKE